MAMTGEDFRWEAHLIGREHEDVPVIVQVGDKFYELLNVVHCEGTRILLVAKEEKNV